MPPDNKSARAKALLNATAAEQVRDAKLDSVSPLAADPDAVELLFEGEAARYASDWLQSNEGKAASAQPFAFVFSRSIESDAQLLKKAAKKDVERYQAFRSQKLTEVAGCLILVTVNFEMALVMPIEAIKNSQQLLNVITDLGVADRQIVVFEPSMKNLIFLRHGANGASRSQLIMATGTRPRWKLAELEAEIEQFHDDYTRVPEAILLPWRSPASAGITLDKLEIRISKALAGFLDQRWKRGSVLAESPSNSGRIDIFLSEHILEEKSGPCVIEVKVLRSRNSTGKMIAPKFVVEWAKKGVMQASLYRKDKKAPAAYLYCFDARDKDGDLPDVDALAAQLEVKHRKHFMHRSTDSLQNAELAKAEASASASDGAVPH